MSETFDPEIPQRHRSSKIAEIAEKLHERKRKLLSKEAPESFGSEVPTGPGDIADIEIDSKNSDNLVSTEVRHSKELVEVDEAIERYRDGVYGVCTGCNKNISIPRLQAIPTVELCIKCQSQKERAGASGRG